jgi:hypothetical protein
MGRFLHEPSVGQSPHQLANVDRIERPSQAVGAKLFHVAFIGGRSPDGLPNRLPPVLFGRIGKITASGKKSKQKTVVNWTRLNQHDVVIATTAGRLSTAIGFWHSAASIFEDEIYVEQSGNCGSFGIVAA